MNGKHIVLVSTGQPGSNPRMVKEADALCEAGYEVTVCCSYWADWAMQIDGSILPGKRWKVQLCGGTPENKRELWQWTRLRKKLSRWLVFSNYFQRRYMARAYDELYKAALSANGDLYHAHNLGALPVVAEVAEHLGKPYGFDAEDYHSEEEFDHGANALKKRMEDKYLPNALICTAASPMIAEAYSKRFKKQFHVINNVFSIQYQTPFQSRPQREVLTLFWFSQTVGFHRGLEDVLQALALLKEVPIKMVLAGTVSDAVKTSFFLYIQSSVHSLEFTGPVAEYSLFEMAAKSDVGLALERKEPKNRDMCLTNKLFTYLLGGNALLVSNTRAQEQFLNEFPSIGGLYPVGTFEAVAHNLKYWYNNQDVLETMRRNAWELAHQTLHWEKESEKFLRLVKEALSPS